jgi:hypothetical protein
MGPDPCDLGPIARKKYFSIGRIGWKGTLSRSRGSEYFLRANRSFVPAA